MPCTVPWKHQTVCIRACLGYHPSHANLEEQLKPPHGLVERKLEAPAHKANLQAQQILRLSMSSSPRAVKDLEKPEAREQIHRWTAAECVLFISVQFAILVVFLCNTARTLALSATLSQVRYGEALSVAQEKDCTRGRIRST